MKCFSITGGTEKCASFEFYDDVLSANLQGLICRICVGTWNVGGRFPPSDLDIEEWLDMEDPADIYVIG